MSISNKVSHYSPDQLVTMRAKMLLFAAFSFGLWQYTWIARDIIAVDSLLSYQIVGWSSVIGSVCWAIATFLFIRFNKRMKEANACSAIHDELVIKNRNYAFFVSYIVLFASTWTLIPALHFWPFDAKFAVRIVATSGVILPMLIFAIAELRNEEGCE